ncbi:hypothetical protein [Pararhodobacter zhoushanensis]|uniref:hypothetical protein n=1 Tax=Pararhodobacter zhoushanensis TaxID=2479545 RepID=UPI000F8DF515|nr:hypothetical protein [Pararhodobacter zhoushanensis]
MLLKTTQAALFGAAAALALSAANPALAQVIDLEGRTVTIVHNASPGGSTGLTAQLVADAWTHTMAGEPTIIVQSVEGGALSRGILQVMNARPDGRTLGWLAWQGSTRILDPEDRQIAFQDFGLIGGAGGATFVLHASVNPEIGLSTGDDLPSVEHFTFGGFSARSAASIRTAGVMDMLGVDYTFVSGFAGDTPLEAARQRGEIDGFPVTGVYYNRTLVPGPIADGTDVPIFYFTGPNEDGTGLAVDPLIDGVEPFDVWYTRVRGEAPSGPIWDMIQYHGRVTDPINWLVVAPPGTPEEHLQMLRESFAAATQDPTFLAEAERVLGQVPQISYYEDVQAIVDEIAATPEDMRQLMRDYIAAMEH